MKTLDLSTEDRLSELSDSLILEILSLMYMRDVVRTTILSKRWKDLWTSIPSLHFELHAKRNSVRDRKFICQVLLRWKGINIRDFTIVVVDVFDGLQSDMDLWMRFATEKKVESLFVSLPFHWLKPLEYCPPQCVYSCSSIKELWMIGFGSNLEIQEKVQWDNLKSLYLHGISFHEAMINKVVSSTPCLEKFEFVPKEVPALARVFPQVERLVVDWKLDDWYPIFRKNLSRRRYKHSGRPFLKLRTVEIIVYSDHKPSALELISSFWREHATMLHKTVILKGEQVVKIDELKAPTTV